MKLWQSLERADQPKTKPNGKTQAEDEDMGLFGEIKQKEVTREKKGINLNKEKWVWSGNPRRHLCYCLEKKRNQTLTGPLIDLQHHRHGAPTLGCRGVGGCPQRACSALINKPISGMEPVSTSVNPTQMSNLVAPPPVGWTRTTGRF